MRESGTEVVGDVAASERRVVWLFGIVAGAVALGPLLAPGSLLNLDLITTPEVPLPPGTWGLGPELPRRVPLYLPVAWLSQIVSGDLVLKLLMVAIVALAFAGVARRAEPLALPVRLGAGALYALNPFLLTRLSVGHLTIALGTALLPWALPALRDPGRSGARTLRWSAALGLAGAHGAVLLVAVMAAGALSGSRTRPRVGLLAASLGQLPWAVPGAIVWMQSRSAAGAASFPTELQDPAQALGVLAGHGFWQPVLQLGWQQWFAAPAAGLFLALLAGMGLGAIGRHERRFLGVLAVCGLVVAMIGSVGPLTDLWDTLSTTAPLAALREGHRLVALALLPLHLAAAHGVARVAAALRPVLADLAHASLGAMAVVLALPAVWGLGGLSPQQWPDDWQEARAAVVAAPGPVLVLPWHLYLDVSWAGGRRLLNPVPVYFGGDVLTSSDPEFGPPQAERGDPREPRAAELAEQVRRGRPIAVDLAQLGVRWVVLLHERPGEDYRSVLREVGLRPVVQGEHLALLEVRSWPGSAVDADGRPVLLETLVAPLARLDDSGAVTMHRSGGWGWRRGSDAAQTSTEGNLLAPAGRGPLWYPPAAATLLAFMVTLSAVLATFSSRLRGESRNRAAGSVMGAE